MRIFSKRSVFIVGLIIFCVVGYYGYSLWHQAKIKEWEKKAEKLGTPDYKKLSKDSFDRFKNTISKYDTPTALKKINNFATAKFYHRGSERDRNKFLKIFDLYLFFLTESDQLTQQQKCFDLSLTLLSNLTSYDKSFGIGRLKPAITPKLEKLNQFVARNCLDSEGIAKSYENLILVNKKVGTLDSVPDEIYLSFAREIEKYSYFPSERFREIIYSHLPENYEPYEPDELTVNEIKKLSDKEKLQWEKAFLIDKIKEERQKKDPREQKLSKWEKQLREKYNLRVNKGGEIRRDES